MSEIEILGDNDGMSIVEGLEDDDAGEFHGLAYMIDRRLFLTSVGS